MKQTFLLLIFLLCGTVFAQQIVTSTSDSGQGTLRQAINDTPNGGTITFANNLADSTITLTSYLAISKSLTIKGNGIIISGGNTVNILSVTSGTVNIEKVHFKNGNNGGNGGGVKIGFGSTVNFQNCIFSGNKSGFANGGALLNEGTLNIVACTLLGNLSPYGYGAAIYNNSGNTTIMGSIFYGNTANIDPKLINSTGGTVVSKGYNVSDAASAYLNNSSDKVDMLNSFVNISTGQPNVTFTGWNTLLQIIPSGLQEFPTEDFNGTSRVFPTTSGAIDASGLEQTPDIITPYPGGSGIYDKLVWDDEFDVDGFPNDLKWSYETGYVRNNELQYYTEKRAENIGVSNGVLTITARKDNAVIDGLTREITSASIHTKNKGDWKYGRIEVRAMLPVAINGTWPAIWMLFSNPTYGWWPNSGEIDIMEQVGYTPYAVFETAHAYNYYNGNTTGGTSAKTISFNDNTISTKFHVYSIEWFSDRIDYYFDSEKKFTVSNPNTDWKDWPFDNKFYLILNLAFGGSWGGAAGVNKEALPAEYQIDYVRVFQNSATSAQTTHLTENNIKVTNSGLIKFINTNHSDLKIELINLQGQLIENVFSGNLAEGEYTFQINMKFNGLYILKISEGSNIYCRKVYLAK